MATEKKIHFCIKKCIVTEIPNAFVYGQIPVKGRSDIQKLCYREMIKHKLDSYHNIQYLYTINSRPNQVLPQRIKRL